MKKLMMFLVVASITVISQAASIKWSASNIYNGNTTDKINGGAAYLFVDDGSITADSVAAFLGNSSKTLAEKQTYLGNSLANTTTSSGAINYTTDVSLSDGSYDF